MLRIAFVLQVLFALLHLTPATNLIAQKTPSLKSDADSVVKKFDESSSILTKEELRQILLAGSDDKEKCWSTLGVLNDLDDDQDLQEPIFRLMKSLALNNDMPEESRKLAVIKLTHFLWGSEIVRNEAKVALNEVKKVDAGYADQIDKAFERAPEMLRIKKLRQIKYKSFSHPKEEIVAHPKDQTDQQRAETLGIEIASAIRLIKANKDQEFIERYYDPYYFVDGANTTDENVVDFILQVMDGSGKGRIRQDMENQISKGLDWSLEGRMAWAKKKPHERPPFGTWIFRDGRWYYSMIQNHGRGIEPATAEPVGFFADSQAFPTLEFSKLKDEKVRLASLRATQQKTLDLAKAGSSLEIYQQVLSPTIFGNLAASSLDVVSTNDVVSKFRTSPKIITPLLANIEQQIIYQQKQDPVWHLDGRVATFKRKQDGDALWDYVKWEFFEGRWRLSLY